MGLVGSALGSNFGGILMTGGRRSGCLILAIPMIIGVALSLVLNLPAMIIGRLLIGFSGGMYQLCQIKAIQETVPSKQNATFATSPGGFVGTGCFLVCFVGGVSLPADEENYADDQMWRLNYALPIIPMIIQLILLLVVWKVEPIDYNIKRNKDEDVMKMLVKLFDIPQSANMPS